jgi:hypothetical protein
MGYSNLDKHLNELYKRQSYLLNIIGFSNEDLYTEYNMDPRNLVKIYDALLNQNSTFLNLILHDELKIWEIYRCQLELNFLNAQIKYYTKFIATVK